MTRFVLAAIAVVFSSVCALAETTRVRTVPDGEVRFNASINGPTRISVVGDRISRILQTDSAFEMVNDEGTGDVFLRFSGGELARENGYIVTESGVTIAFAMTPRPDLDMQTVLITVQGSRAGGVGPGFFRLRGQRIPRAIYAFGPVGDRG